MKKVIAIMLSLILVFSFSACSKNKNDDNKIEGFIYKDLLKNGE